MRVRAVLAVTLCMACGCKEKQDAAPAKPVTTAPAAPAQPPASKPSLPEPAPDEPRAPVTIAEATALLPKLEGTQIIPLKQTSDQRQVHGTWCIDGSGADDVAKQIGHAMAQAKFTNISIRGDARKSGVAADRDGLRMSMVVSASGAQICAAPAHYFASATIYRL